jgi:hypothetical protein
MFEGLGVGSRLSALRLPPNLRWAPYIASFLYSVTTYAQSRSFLVMCLWLTMGVPFVNLQATGNGHRIGRQLEL